MASSSSSSSISQETQVLHHPYQCIDLPGPKGAYEARQVSGGLYVRVDMPGVPTGHIKFRKYSDKQTLTFTGKAPVVWDNLDSSERVYGGYVALNRDPCQLDLLYTHKNGVLRMFFPNSEGTLHSLSSKKTSDVYVFSGISSNPDIFPEQDPSMNADAAAAKFCDYDKDLIEMNRRMRELMFKEGLAYKAPELDQHDQGLPGGNTAHINPFLLSGVEGVYEQKVDDDERGECVIYLRMDMPGVSSKQHFTNAHNNFKRLGYGGQGGLESSYDDGGRRYMAMMFLNCKCCFYKRVKEEVKDGVFRLMARQLKCTNNRKRLITKEVIT